MFHKSRNFFMSYKTGSVDGNDTYKMGSVDGNGTCKMGSVDGNAKQLGDKNSIYTLINACHIKGMCAYILFDI